MGHYFYPKIKSHKIDKNLILLAILTLEHMDYLPVTGGLITFGPNDSILSFNVTLVNDDVLESEEVFHVLLAASVSQSTYVKLEDHNASVAITDQDS